MPFARARAWFGARPMLGALVLLVAMIAVNRTLELFYDADYDFHRMPWNYAWPFVLGLVLAAANDLRTQLFALAVSIVVVLEYWGLTSAGFYLGGGCALVLFVRSFMVSAPVKVLVAEIAGASLFIYLFHCEIMSLDKKLLGVIHPRADLITQIIVEIVASNVYSWG
jgi:hypothetical protein